MPRFASLDAAQLGVLPGAREPVRKNPRVVQIGANTALRPVVPSLDDGHGIIARSASVGV
jgi:hypothetical protein